MVIMLKKKSNTRKHNHKLRERGFSLCFGGLEVSSQKTAHHLATRPRARRALLSWAPGICL